MTVTTGKRPADTPPFLNRVAQSTNGADFARAAASLQLFELFRSATGADRSTRSASEVAKTAVHLAKLFDNGIAARSQEDDALMAVCASLAQWEQTGARPLLELATSAAWLTFARAVFDDGDAATALFVTRFIGVKAEIDGVLALSAQARHWEAFYCLRQADLDSAAHLFAHSLRLARAAGDLSTVLRAQLGQANVTWLRGNLPKAEAAMQRICRLATGAAYDVLPTALLMRGAVAHARGDFPGAVEYAFNALEASDDESTATRSLAELASFLTELPDPATTETARRALEYVNASSPEQSTRHHAALALMSLALERRDVGRFISWRATLAVEPLRPRHAVYYALYRATGARVFNLPDNRDEWLAQAAATATAHGLAQLSFAVENEAALPVGAIDTSGSPPEPDRKLGRHSAERVSRLASQVDGYLDAAFAATA